MIFVVMERLKLIERFNISKTTNFFYFHILYNNNAFFRF